MEPTLLTTQALPGGTRLEEFVIERVLGSGGFGITYLARDTALGRQVVIKENLPVQFCFRDTNSLTVSPRHTHGDDAENFQWSLENFSKEAAMLASLDHPGIVRVLRSFQACGTAYFVMPFVEGVAFDQLIEERQRVNKPFTEGELTGLLERVLGALRYLHERGIYHRDIKPGNILISNDGVPVLIDFGSARQQLSERSMTVIESPGYTPFEQQQSRGNVGPWSDLYAMGATLEKAATGSAPPKAMDRVRNDPHAPLVNRDDLTRAYSRQFLESLDKALEVDECLRWQDADEWLHALSPSLSACADMASPPAQGTQAEKTEHIGHLKAVHVVQTDSQRIRKIDDFKVCSPSRRWLVIALTSLLVLSGMTVGYFKLFAAKANAPPSTKLVDLPPTDWKTCAEGGDPFAQALMARANWVGTDGYPEDPKAATAWARKAAAANHPLGTYMLGSCIYKDLGQPKQEREAEADRLFSKAMTQGFLKDAEHGGKQWIERVGDAYLLGRGISKSVADALHYFQTAAEQGDPHAMARVGLCYERGDGVEENIGLALEWYRKAAKLNEPRAITALGQCYLDGDGVTKDEFGAVKLFQKASNMGSSEAMNSMSRCYWHGDGVSSNKYESYNFSKISADLGNADGMLLIGIQLLFGEGCQKNEVEALKWLRKAVECDINGAVSLIGKCYEEGWGVKQDQDKAIELYRKAADEGDKLAIEDLKRLGK